MGDDGKTEKKHSLFQNSLFLVDICIPIHKQKLYKSSKIPIQVALETALEITWL